MWSNTDRFRQSIAKPHRNKTVITVTPAGSATPQTLPLKAGRVTVDGTAQARRKVTLDLFGTSTDYDTITAPGATFRITHGIQYGVAGDEELMPVFTGELVDGSQQLGDGTISVSLADHMQWLQRCRFLAPYVPTASLTRAQVISAIATDAKPGTTVITTATDTGLVGAQMWPFDRLAAIHDLCADGNMDAFFQPDGAFLIRDKPTLTTAPVYTVAAGVNGTLTSAARKRPLDKLYNTWVVRPSAADGTQTWPQQSVTITDPTNPRHYLKIGTVPYFWDSPTIATAANALAVAATFRDRALGTAETLALGAVSNPALEAGDVLRVITPQINEQPSQIFQHFLDQLTFDLVSGAMTNQTRSQVDTGA